MNVRAFHGPSLENSVLSFEGSPCLDVDCVEFGITVISVGTKSSSDIHVFSRCKPSTNQRRSFQSKFCANGESALGDAGGGVGGGNYLNVVVKKTIGFVGLGLIG